MARKTPTPAEVLTARKYQVIERAIELVKWPFIILVSWVPATAMQPMVHDLAGKDTNVNAALSVTVTWGLVSSAGWAYSANSARKRKNSLEKARSRSDSLEARLLDEEEVST